MGDEVQFPDDISENVCWIVFILDTHPLRGVDVQPLTKFLTFDYNAKYRLTWSLLTLIMAGLIDRISAVVKLGFAIHVLVKDFVLFTCRIHTRHPTVTRKEAERSSQNKVTNNQYCELYPNSEYYLE